MQPPPTQLPWCRQRTENGEPKRTDYCGCRADFGRRQPWIPRDAQVQAATETIFLCSSADRQGHSIELWSSSPFGASHVHGSGARQVARGTATCMLALDSSTSSTLGLDAASLRAPECAVYSNAAVFDGLALTNGGKISARFICSAGGATGSSSGYTPTARLDCPALKDPFGQPRPASAEVCTTTNLIVSGGSRTLTPGVYCGGLKITTGAAVTLSPGVYVLKNGPLVVDKQSCLTADGAGFFLTGATRFSRSTTPQQST